LWYPYLRSLLTGGLLAAKVFWCKMPQIINLRPNPLPAFAGQKDFVFDVPFTS
jgi:hypothetical protein